MNIYEVIRNKSIEEMSTEELYEYLKVKSRKEWRSNIYNIVKEIDKREERIKESTL